MDKTNVSLNQNGVGRIALVAIAVTCAVLVGASTANAGHYHTNCVGHGYVHGSSTIDNAFHSRVEAGCGNPGKKTCLLRKSGVNIGGTSVPTGQNSTCNFFGCCSYNEETSWADVDFDGVFASHTHLAHIMY